MVDNIAEIRSSIVEIGTGLTELASGPEAEYFFQTVIPSTQRKQGVVEVLAKGGESRDTSLLAFKLDPSVISTSRGSVLMEYHDNRRLLLPTSYQGLIQSSELLQNPDGCDLVIKCFSGDRVKVPMLSYGKRGWKAENEGFWKILFRANAKFGRDDDDIGMRPVGEEVMRLKNGLVAIGKGRRTTEYENLSHVDPTTPIGKQDAIKVEPRAERYYPLDRRLTSGRNEGPLPNGDGGLPRAEIAEAMVQEPPRITDSVITGKNAVSERQISAMDVEWTSDDNMYTQHVVRPEKPETVAFIHDKSKNVSVGIPQAENFSVSVDKDGRRRIFIHYGDGQITLPSTVAELRDSMLIHKWGGSAADILIPINTNEGRIFVKAPILSDGKLVVSKFWQNYFQLLDPKYFNHRELVKLLGQAYNRKPRMLNLPDTDAGIDALLTGTNLSYNKIREKLGMAPVRINSDDSPGFLDRLTVVPSKIMGAIFGEPRKRIQREEGSIRRDRGQLPLAERGKTRKEVKGRKDNYGVEGAFKGVNHEDGVMQDRMLVAPIDSHRENNGCLYVVCDGVGSGIKSHEIAEMAAAVASDNRSLPTRDICDIAHRQVTNFLRTVSMRPEYTRAGSTMTAVKITPDGQGGIEIGGTNSGDTPSYLLSPAFSQSGQLILYQDHSYLDPSHWSIRDRNFAHGNNVITQSLGSAYAPYDTTIIRLTAEQLRSQPYFMALMSDGVQHVLERASNYQMEAYDYLMWMIEKSGFNLDLVKQELDKLLTENRLPPDDSTYIIRNLSSMFAGA